MIKKLAALLAGAALMIGMAAGSAMALSIPDSGINKGKLVTDAGIYSDFGVEAVTLTDTDGVDDTATAFLLLEFAGYAGTNKLGIYGFTGSGSSVASVNKLQVFSGINSPTSTVQLLFDIANGIVTNNKTGDSAYIGTTFGFYLDATIGNEDPDAIFYTHTVLNQDGEDHFKIYNTRIDNGDELFGSTVVLGIEDLYGGGDRDFNDMIVGVTDVAPVPEPGTMVLLGAGLLGLAIFGKRRMNQA